MSNNTGDNMDQQTTGPDCLTSDLAGLAAREAGAPARGPTRIEEIRGRLEAFPGVFARSKPVGESVTHELVAKSDGRTIALMTNREDWVALHSALVRAPDDLGYLLNELAGYQSDLLAGERALKEARRERDDLRASHERFRRIVLAVIDTLGVRYDEIPQDPDAAAEKAAAMVRRAVGGASDALADARAEVAELKVAHAGKCKAWQEAEKDLDTVARELESVTADLARARRILAVEQGREGPEGWRYDCTDGVWWRKETAGRAWRGWRWVDSGKVPVWRWSCQAQTGHAEAALDALEAADRVADEAREDGAIRRVAGGPASPG